MKNQIKNPKIDDTEITQQEQYLDSMNDLSKSLEQLALAEKDRLEEIKKQLAATDQD